MNKYSGCNRVRVYVRQEKSAAVKVVKRRRFIIRTVIATFIFCLAMIFNSIPATREVLNNVLCYDVLGETEFGDTSLTALFDGK